MRENLNHIEPYRVQVPGYPHVAPGENYGAFFVPSWGGWKLFIIVTPGVIVTSWDHVSVHAMQPVKGKRAKTRMPTWDEMCKIKALCWEEEETVVQYHPAKSQYVNQHPHCLHLWQPTAEVLPVPPPMLVGIMDLENQANAEENDV